MFTSIVAENDVRNFEIYENQRVVLKWYANLESISLKPSGNYSSLKELHLNDNNLQLKDLELITNLTNLENLSVSRNPIGNFDLEMFAGLTKLRFLATKGIRMTEIRNSLQIDLPSMTWLEFSKNQITTVDLNFTHSFPNLKRLYLDKNRIQSIENGLMGNLTSVIHLDFSSNNLSKIDFGIFRTFPSLNRILLHDNRIIHIDGFANLDRFFVGIQQISIEKNEWKCLNLENAVGQLKNFSVKWTSFVGAHENERPCDEENGIIRRLHEKICCISEENDEGSIKQFFRKAFNKVKSWFS